MAEEILTSFRRTNSENFGAGEGHHEFTDSSVKHDVPEDCELTKTESIKNKNTSSRWSSLTRIFRVGLGAGPAADMPNIASSQEQQLTMQNKRGSLGKFFRQGFGHSVPSMLNESDINSSAALKDLLPQSKRGSLARIFRQSKPVDLEENHVKELEDCEVYGGKKEIRKQHCDSIWKRKFGSDRRNPRIEETFPNMEPLCSFDASASNPEQKRNSLGKLFRMKQNSRISKEVSHT